MATEMQKFMEAAAPKEAAVIVKNSDIHVDGAEASLYCLNAITPKDGMYYVSPYPDASELFSSEENAKAFAEQHQFMAVPEKEFISELNEQSPDIVQAARDMGFKPAAALKETREGTAYGLYVDTGYGYNQLGLDNTWSDGGMGGDVTSFVEEFADYAEEHFHTYFPDDIHTDKGADKWLEEVRRLSPGEFNDEYPAAKPTKPPFPEKAENAEHVQIYLHKTCGIDNQTISSMLDRNLLYESRDDNSAVFVGVSSDGKQDFAKLHTTMPDVAYAATYGGNSEKTGWYVENHSDKLYVTEEPIDAMSLMSVKRMDGENPGNANYLATCGAEAAKVVCNCLKSERNIKEVVFAEDKLPSTQKAIQDTVNTVSKEFPSVTYKQYELPNGCGKDVNDYLKYRNSHEQFSKRSESQNQAMAQEPVSPEI